MMFEYPYFGASGYRALGQHAPLLGEGLIVGFGKTLQGTQLGKVNMPPQTGIFYQRDGFLHNFRVEIRSGAPEEHYPVFKRQALVNHRRTVKRVSDVIGRIQHGLP